MPSLSSGVTPVLGALRPEAAAGIDLSQWYSECQTMMLDNIKSLILEIAFERSRAESTITELGLPVLSRMIKILKWEDSCSYLKDVEDIDAWLFDVQRVLIRPKGKRFKPEQYFKFLFEEQIESVIDVTHNINRDLRQYKSLKQINSDIEVYERLTKIYKRLSFDLSNDQFEGIENYL